METKTNTIPDFDFQTYHDEAIRNIIIRFSRTKNSTRINSSFESDFVFRESDAIAIVEFLNFKLSLSFEVGYQLAYEGCWEINFKKLLNMEG